MTKKEKEEYAKFLAEKDTLTEKEFDWIINYNGPEFPDYAVVRQR